MSFMEDLMGGLGIRRMLMQQAGLSTGQIDMLEGLTTRYPALNDLNMREVLTDPSKAALKQDIMGMLDNPQLAETFGQQVQADPALVHRLNHLIANDPERLRTMLPEFQRTPDRLGAILNQAVSPAQAQAAQVASEQAARNPLANLGNLDFRQMFSGFADNFSMENIGQILLAVINGIYGLVDGLVGGLSRFMQSDELVVSGNGGNRGPAAQARELVAGAGGPVMYREGPEGAVTSVPRPGEEPAPAGAQPQTTERQPPVQPVVTQGQPS